MAFAIRRTTLLILAMSALAIASARAETPEEWVALGTRVHGFFGGFIPAGIRIGLDAKERLHAEMREVSILYYAGPTAPCPCIVDGAMLAIGASPGQGTVKIADEKAPEGDLAVIVFTHRKTGEAVRYVVSDEWLPRMLAWNKEEPLKRYQDAMEAEGLFKVEAAPKQ